MSSASFSGRQTPRPCAFAASPGLDAASVIARIETTAETLITAIAEGGVPVLQLGPKAGARVPQNDDEDEDGEEDGSQRCVQRSLLGNQGAAALAYARVLAVLNAVHDLLRQGRQATQRDLYYTLLRPPLFCSPRDVNAAVADAAALLRVPRSSLGVTCAGRGAVAGRLQMRDGPASPWVDCGTAGPSGRALPGDLSTIARLGLQLMAPHQGAAATAAAAAPAASAAAAAPAGSLAGVSLGGSSSGSMAASIGSCCYLLVVEKDAVFQRLAEDRIWEHLPCVLVTAKGVPDLATRAFAARLAASFPAPRLIPLGLVDYNPAGVVILMTYKYGSDRMGPEGRAHPLPGLRWLGLRSGQMGHLEEGHLQRLTERDRVMARGLRERLAGVEPGWAAELEAMEAAGFKGDIEALYRSSGHYAALRDLVVRAVISRDIT